jgi:phenylacetate-CoA ligase
VNSSPLARIQAQRLAALMRAVLAGNAFYRKKLAAAGIDPGTLAGQAAPETLLAELPFTSKSELLADQQAHPPFGTNQTRPDARYVRLHQTSGTSGRPLVWIDTAESWGWVVDCWIKIYRGIGLSPTDRIFFPFSFGPFLGFWSAFEGAVRSGNLAIPGGGMTTVARLEAIRSLGATVVAATPTYALHMAEVAREERIDLRAAGVRALIVAGEPGGSVASTREKIEEAWGARCFDHCGMTEVGPFGYECPEAPCGMHVLEEDYIVEVVDPRTGERLPEGSEGELVITNLGRTASPVLRYRTGDLVRWSRRPCACGAARGRLEGGILGRMDDMVIVRGNNVFPSAVDAILRKIPEVGEYRVRLRKKDEMTHLILEVEPSGAGRAGEPRGTEAGDPRGTHPPGGDPPGSHPPGSGPEAWNQDLARRISSAMESAFLFQPEVALVPCGTLPRFELKARRWIKEF